MESNERTIALKFNKYFVARMHCTDIDVNVYICMCCMFTICMPGISYLYSRLQIAYANKLYNYYYVWYYHLLEEFGIYFCMLLIIGLL